MRSSDPSPPAVAKAVKGVMSTDPEKLLPGRPAASLVGASSEEGSVARSRAAARQAAAGTLARASRTAARGAAGDSIFRILVAGAGYTVLISLVAAIISLIGGGRAAFQKFGWQFITSTEWDPVAQRFGALVSIYGTLVTSAIAILLAVPISFGVALFLTEIAPPWLKRPVASAVELLAGIPSIIYGMWGLFVFVPFMADHIEPWIDGHLGMVPGIGKVFSGPPLGIGMLTAGIILGVMIVPFISSVMRDVFTTVPATLKESAYALGCSTWEVVWDIVLPYTRKAVVGGIFLGLGRALGETMAVTFVLGNAHHLSASLLEPGNSIAATLANEFTEADSDIYLSSLIALGLLLFVVTVIVLGLARVLLRVGDRKVGA